MKDSEFQLLSQRLTKTEFKINRNFSNKDKKIALKLSSNIKISKMKNKNEAVVIFKSKCPCCFNVVFKKYSHTINSFCGLSSIDTTIDRFYQELTVNICKDQIKLYDSLFLLI